MKIDKEKIFELRVRVFYMVDENLSETYEIKESKDLEELEKFVGLVSEDAVYIEDYILDFLETHDLYENANVGFDVYIVEIKKE